jgi:hypothetical protein
MEKQVACAAHTLPSSSVLPKVSAPPPLRMATDEQPAFGLLQNIEINWSKHYPLSFKLNLY